MAKKHQTFKFRTIEELHAIPIEKIEHFCRDLGLWLTLNKIAEAHTSDQIKVTTPRDVFGWIDDGKHDVNLTIKIKEK